MNSASSLPGIHLDAVAVDAALVAGLDAGHMARLPVVPKTVMGAVLPPDEPWLRLDAAYPGQMRERLALLAAHRSKVIDRIDTPHARAAEVELRNRVVTYLLRTYPEQFRKRGKVVSTPLTGVAVDLAEARPMEAVAALHNSDFLLMLPAGRIGRKEKGRPRQRVFRLMSGALLTPNGWSLRSHFDEPEPDAAQAPAAHAAWQARRAESLRHARLGKSAREIHAGVVPHYDRHFRDAADRMLNALQPGRTVWRRNWAPPLTTELFLHPDAPPPPLPEPTPGNMLRHGFIRSEQQTFLRLPGSRAVVFNVHTYLWPLREVLADPAAHRALRTAQGNLSAEMRQYRSELLAVLDQVLASCPLPGQSDDQTA